MCAPDRLYRRYGEGRKDDYEKSRKVLKPGAVMPYVYKQFNVHYPRLSDAGYGDVLLWAIAAARSGSVRSSWQAPTGPFGRSGRQRRCSR